MIILNVSLNFTFKKKNIFCVLEWIRNESKILWSKDNFVQKSKKNSNNSYLRFRN